MKIKSVQTRLLLILLPIILIVLGLLSGVSYYFSYHALNSSINQTAMAVGTDYGNRVKNDMLRMILQLEDLASIQRIRNGVDRGQIVEAMAEAQKRLGTFDVIVFISPDGSGITSTGATAMYADREYFKKVVATKKAVVSDPLISKATGKMAVVLAVPVSDGGRLTGVLVGTFSVERLTTLIKDLKFLETGYGQIADAAGTIIAHPKRPELIGKLNLLNKKINQELKLQQSELDDRLINMFKSAVGSGKQIQGVYNFDSVTRVAVFTPIDLPGDQRWIMSVAAPEAEATRETDVLARMMLIISVACLIIAVVAIVFIARQFTKPISLIRDECLLLAQGDFREHPVRVESEDEIGQLAQGFRQMRTNLRGLIGRVNSQAEQVAASSEELTASAEQSAQAANQVATSITNVANGADEQLAAADETSAIVGQMSAGIQQVAANTNQVAAQSALAAEKAQEGDKTVEKAVSQMAQIADTVNTSANVVAKLGARSQEIGEIVDTISGIAGQTNLLALNAAIEAARAGEQGRGFAVVAEEVRKLAEQSQEAAKRIAELIGEIQGDTDKAVVAMNEGTKEVKTGAEVVNAAGIAFQEIVELVSQVSSQVREISAAIQQMASGSQQIVLSVKKIDEHSKTSASEAQSVSAATQEQLASMEEISGASEALSKLAQDLQAAVAKFRV